MQHLNGDQLMATVRALADDIGPRPAGHPAEEQARAYLQEQLHAAGINQTERIAFATPDSWSCGTIAPLALSLAGNLVARLNSIAGGAVSLLGAYEFWKMMSARHSEQWLLPLYPQHPGGTLLAKIPPSGEVKQRVVLIGHTDSNKHRPSFAPSMRQFLVAVPTSLLVAAAANGIAALFNWKRPRDLTALYIVGMTAMLLADDVDEYIDGANDNASAVACTLGMGQHAAANPLQHTEIWLAFTGSEEVGLMGLDALLDAHNDALRDAWFIDFEMVGAGNIHYVTHHSSFTAFTGYTPDAESVAVAEAAARKHPELGVTGRDAVINEEVATLRRRGYRGICLVGLDNDGWLVNWHRHTDTSANIQPEALQTAAHFAWAMIEEIDART